MNNNGSSIKNEKKIKIVFAAEKIFTEKGYHKTKVEDIAKEVGMGKSTFYEYFSSKAEILDYILDFSSQMFFKVLLHQQKQAVTTREKLKSIVYCSLAICVGYDGRVRLYSPWVMSSHMQDWPKEFCEKYWQPFTGIVRSILIEGMEKGEIAEDDVDILISVFMGSVASTIHHYATKMPSVDFSELPLPEVDELNDDYMNIVKKSTYNGFYEESAEKIISIFWNGIGKNQ